MLLVISQGNHLLFGFVMAFLRFCCATEILMNGHPFLKVVSRWIDYTSDDAKVKQIEESIISIPDVVD